MKLKSTMLPLLGAVLLSCGEESGSMLDGNSSSPVSAAQVGCQQGVIALQNADKTVEVSGKWRGASSLRTLSVNGKAATVNADGSWKVNAPGTAGLNLFPTQASAANGQSFSLICAVYAAPAVIAPKDMASDSVLLVLRQSAFDDGDAATDKLESIADILRIAADSIKVHDLIHEALNVDTKKGEKLNRAFYYRSISYADPQIKIALLKDGFQLTLRLPSVRIKGVIRRTGGLIRPERDAVLKLSHVEIKPTFKVSLDSSKKVKVSVKTPIPEPSFGTFDSDVDGGLIPELIEEIINGQDSKIKGEISNSLRAGIEGQLNEVLKAYFDNLAIRALPEARVTVPKLDGSGSSTLNLVSKLDGLSFDENKALLRVATRVDGATAADESEWLPGAASTLPKLFTETSGSSGGAISTTLLNQALYRLWKNGNFKMDSVTGLNTRITSASVAFSRPPVVTMGSQASELELGIAPATLTMKVDGASIPVQIYAKYKLPLDLDNVGKLSFKNATLLDGHVDLPESFNWAEASVKNILLPLLTAHFNRVFQSLEPVSIPSFPIPDAMAVYGLPPKVVMGIIKPRIEKDANYMVISGVMGEIFRPSPPAPEPETCIDGRQRREGCASGYHGYILAECRNNSWIRIQNNCVRDGNPGGGDRPEL